MNFWKPLETVEKNTKNDTGFWTNFPSFPDCILAFQAVPRFTWSLNMAWSIGLKHRRGRFYLWSKSIFQEKNELRVLSSHTLSLRALEICKKNLLSQWLQDLVVEMRDLEKLRALDIQSLQHGAGVNVFSSHKKGGHCCIVPWNTWRGEVNICNFQSKASISEKKRTAAELCRSSKLFWESQYGIS